jgi:hypothetical protein
MDYPNESLESPMSLEGCPGYPYIEFGARSYTKKEVLLTEES